MNKVKISTLIASSFYVLHKTIKEGLYTHHWVKGGRGSTKSSCISIEIPLNMMKDAQQGIMTNAVIFRRVKDTLRGSVFEQVLWAIDQLKCNDEWEVNYSPLKLTYKATGQVILFKGADKPLKMKSIKVSKGYIKYIWYEEVDEFEGIEKVRNINQSVMRGGDKFIVFYSFNPPKSSRSWVNKQMLDKRKDKFTHHSTYLTVPKEWLGEQFIIEAEHLQETKPEQYEHEYLGNVTGTGGEVFTNVTLRKITDDEISKFDKIKRGIDWGYAADPFSYGVMYLDKTRKKLYVFFEIYKTRLSNSKAAGLIKKENKLNGKIIADSAEPKSIADLKEYGLRIVGSRKGPGSVEHGIRYLAEELEEIIIDDERCPNTAREFITYELEKDSNGEWKADYPDKDNHTIDMIRYAIEDEIRSKSISF
jgi:phage terminase large subunit